LSGNLSHSYLLISDDNEVKQNLSILILCRIFCEKKDKFPCLSCPECKKIINNNHSDIHYYSGRINVEDVSKIIEASTLKPYSTDKNIFVITDLGQMNAAAQNKMLKTLEEPQKGVTFLMFSHDESMVLATVKSRSQVYFVENFSAFEIEKELKLQYSQESYDSIAIASAICGGKLDTAVKYLNDDEFKDLYNLVFEIINNMQKSPDILEYQIKVESHKKRLKEFLEIFYIAIRDIMVIKSSSTDIVLCKNRINDIMNAEKSVSLKAGSNILDLIQRMQQRLYYNGNPASVIDELLFSYLEVKALCR
jgi:DNA polymerase-3 subunit delta'